MQNSTRSFVDMSGNTKEDFIIRVGHYQDHEKGTRSLFAQTVLDGKKYWAWTLLVDKDGIPTPEKRPAVKTIGELFVGIFRKEVLSKIQELQEKGIGIFGMTLEERFGKDFPVFDSGINSGQLACALKVLGYEIEYTRSKEKLRIESARIKKI